MVATQTLTHILVVRRPDGTTFQVAGTREDLDLLCGLVKEIPKEVRGVGTLIEIQDDLVYTNSDGKEVTRIPHGNAVHVLDVRHMSMDVEG